ncbi:hypothetical protein [Sulfurospirillum arsenophilum]|uniref:hypothetical protein n=1 Tax=Sulfurospirillum arsenophilum TaxID=56698 RepID=UPI0005A787C8|nr:hypothetical protein [Sulfurospirillum arsenophilum]
MVKKNICMIFIIFTLVGCHGKPPPPQTHEIWIKEGYSPTDVYHALLECGYNKSYNQTHGLTDNEIAEGQLCMLKNGFRYRNPKNHILCDYARYKDLPACQEYIKQKEIKGDRLLK